MSERADIYLVDGDTEANTRGRDKAGEKSLRGCHDTMECNRFNMLIK